jgi:creatinine amidohydrolase
VPAEEFEAVRGSRMGGAGHAGEVETSVMLYLRPELVHQERAFADYFGDADYRRRATSLGPRDMFDPGVATVGAHIINPSGVNGDPTLASPEVGRWLLQTATDRLLAFLREYEASPPDKLRWAGEHPQSSGRDAA